MKENDEYPVLMGRRAAEMMAKNDSIEGARRGAKESIARRNGEIDAYDQAFLDRLDELEKEAQSLP